MELTNEEYRALAEFRFQIRHFLRFSEDAARAEGLEPQQHQFLLAVRAGQDPAGPTVGKIAEQLLIRHHSAVGLTDRLVERGLIERSRNDPDHRLVRLRLTESGSEMLRRLSEAHRTELVSKGPALIKSLQKVLEPIQE